LGDGPDLAHDDGDQAETFGAGNRSRRRGQWQSVRRMRPIMQDAGTDVARTTPLQLVLAWSFAGIPLLAGVAQTLVNAMKLFQ
jgi:hypothetical protein